MFSRARAGSRPRPDVEFACGSRSTSSVGWPASARAAARLIAVVVLPTPPFWLTTATTGISVVANILGLASLAAPISGAIGRNSSLGSIDWPAILLRASTGHGRPAAVGPDRIAGDRDERHLDDESPAEQETRKSDANQQVVADVADARCGGVCVLADEAKPERYREHRDRVDRGAVLGVDRGEEEGSRDQSDPRLQGPTEQDLLADPGQQGHRCDPVWRAELPENVLDGGVDQPREIRRQRVVEDVRLLAKSKKRAGRREGEGEVPPGGAHKSETGHRFGQRRRRRAIDAAPVPSGGGEKKGSRGKEEVEQVPERMRVVGRQNGGWS